MKHVDIDVGVLMGLLDIFGKKDVGKITKGVPFSIKTSFIPVRLASYKGDRTDLVIKLKNNEDENVLVSLVVEVPKALGVDQSCLQKAKEIRIGYLSKQGSQDITVPLWSNVTTKPGDYSITITAFVHYRTYAYVLNSVKKTAEIRVV